MDCSTPGFPVFHISRSLLKLMTIELMMPSNHLILSHPLLLLPSIFPSIRVFSNESTLCIRWPKDWSFSLSISPSNEYSGLISFRADPVRETQLFLIQACQETELDDGIHPLGTEMLVLRSWDMRSQLKLTSLCLFHRWRLFLMEQPREGLLVCAGLLFLPDRP